MELNSTPIMISQRIFLKQFESPESFLYTQYDAHLAKVEEQLNQRSGRRPLTQISPNDIAEGDIIAIFYRPWQKYIISKIVINPNDIYSKFAWLINYGFQIKIRNNPVYKVPTDVDSCSYFVKKGGLQNISSRTENHRSTEIDTKISSILRKASKIYFINSYKTADHHWGDLKVCLRDGKVIDIGEYLVKEGYAVRKYDDHDAQTRELSKKLLEPFSVHNFADDSRKQKECFATHDGLGFSALPEIEKENACAHAVMRHFPGGFDITRLNKYNDPNHWHIRKSTRTENEPPTGKGRSLKCGGKLARFIKESEKVEEILNAENGNFSHPTPLKSEESGFLNNPTKGYAGRGIYFRHLSTLANVKEKQDDNSDLERTAVTPMNANVKLGSGSGNGRGVPLANYDDNSDLERTAVTPMNANVKLGSGSGNGHGVPLANYPKISQIQTGGSIREDNALMDDSEETDWQLAGTFLGSSVVAHSGVPLKQCTSLNDAGFNTHIVDALRLKRFGLLHRSQAYAWPHIARGNSLIVVDKPKSGKTWCYLPAICELIASHASERQKWHGPTAIVFVAAQAQVAPTALECQQLLQHCSNRKWQPVVAYGDERCASQVLIQLLNGCGVFLTTARNFLNLVEAHKQLDCLFRVDVLKHIVLDDVDKMLEYSKLRLTKLIATLFRLFKSGDQLNVPLTVTSRQFIPGFMHRMLQMMRNPLLLIGDLLEAAVYGKMKVYIMICEPTDKFGSVIRQIATMVRTERKIAIVGHSNEDVRKLTASLSNVGISSLDCTQKTERKPAQCEHGVFVYSDADLARQQITNAQTVIHYGMPDTWAQFKKRFGLISDSISNFVDTKLHACSYPSLGVFIYLDESEVAQYRPYLIEFLRRHNMNFSPLFAGQYYTLQAAELTTSEEVSCLCPTLLGGGSCSNLLCQQRHQLTASDLRLDVSNEISGSEEIGIHVCEVYSPTHVAALILRCKPKNQSWKTLPRSFIRIHKGLDIHYGSPSNCAHQWPLRVDDICVVKGQIHYSRVRLVSVSAGQPCDVVAKMLDHGTRLLHLKSNDLFVCAEKFRKEPATAIDIRMTGLVANNDENRWCPEAIEAATTWLKRTPHKNSVIHASIDCMLRETIFVKNIVVMDYLPTTALYVYNVNVKASLKENGFAKVQAGTCEIKEMIKLFNKQRDEAATEGAQKQQLSADNVGCGLDVVTSDDALGKEAQANNQTTHQVIQNADKTDLLNGSVPASDKVVKEQVALCAESSMNRTNEMHFEKLMTSLRRYQAIDNEAAVEVGYTLFGDIFHPKKMHERPNVEKTVAVNTEIKGVLPDDINKEQQPNVAVAAACLPAHVSHNKHPQIIWHDTPAYVHLQIQADRTKDYEISWLADSLVYGDRANNEACCLHFCGLIDTAHVSHELRGLNVYVKMKKQNCGKWPRLLKKDTKNTPNWLKYNIDKYVEEQKQLSESHQKVRLFYETEALKHFKDTAPDSSESSDEWYDALDDDFGNLNTEDY